MKTEGNVLIIPILQLKNLRWNNLNKEFKWMLVHNSCTYPFQKKNNELVGICQARKGISQKIPLSFIANVATKSGAQTSISILNVVRIKKT
jgi:hypothetical protein